MITKYMSERAELSALSQKRLGLIVFISLFLCCITSIKPLDFPDRETLRKGAIGTLAVGGALGLGSIAKNLITMYRIPKEVPKVVCETNYRRPSSFRELIKGRGLGASLDEVKMNPETRIEVERYIEEIKNAIEARKPLPSAVYYGPKGSKRIAAARAIAHALNMRYAIISSYDIAHLAALQRVNAVQNLIDWLKTSGEPIMAIVKETEMVFGPRDNKEMLSGVLSQLLPNMSSNVIFVLETDDYKNLDPELLNRMNRLIKFLVI